MNAAQDWGEPATNEAATNEQVTTPAGGADRPENAGGPMSGRFRLLTIALLSLVTIVAFEAMAISTAMPVVASRLDAVRSYGLAFSFLLTSELLGIVVAGAWCDTRGPLPSLVWGQLLFVAGSIIAGAANTFDVLLVGRLVTGLGGGLITVAMYVVVGRAYPEWMRPKVFGWTSAAWVLPSLVGPPVAGLLTTYSWRLVFLVVVLPVLVTFPIVLQHRAQIPAGPPTGGSAIPGRRMVLFGLAVALAAGVLQTAAEHLRPLAPLALIGIAVGLVGLAFGVPQLLPRGLVRMRRGIPSVMTSRFLLTASFNGTWTFVPLMLVSTRHLSTTVSGLVLTVGSLGWSLGAVVQGSDWAAGRPHRLISAGGLSLTIGVGSLAVIAAFGLPSEIVPVATALCGLGMGLATSSTSVILLSLTDPADHGRASSSINIADVLGSVIGIGLAGAIFAMLHNPARSDVPVFVLIWAILAATAALVVLGGARTVPRRQRAST